MSLRKLVRQWLGASGAHLRSEEEAVETLAHCIDEVATPALHDARQVLEQEGYTVEVRHGPDAVGLHAIAADGSEAYYALEGRLYHPSAFAFPMLHGREDRPRFARLRVECDGGAHEWDCDDCTREALRDECVQSIHTWLGWRSDSDLP